ncbi:hypothetical protein [Corynebacterium sanguinis]|uniref:DUF3923 family protein n=1 Tax=Corynebacterium sanguinis TaxID=2594913 RepID=A0A6C1TXF4_9CORY|nr:hypothetical protein [Corynebacterium sanguinis]MCT1425735.1 hypothetical protein [Corynebacterium sanguinis]MCT1628449.1 hypothetical protein [Corynebacterium sanguinis]TVS28815.1 hypothetical protein EKI59_05650 [Corynebacterium sanguinis]
MNRKWTLVVVALVFSFVLQALREWFQRGRGLIDTFSQWEYASNFLLFWALSFLVILLVFFAIDALRLKLASR